MFPMYFSPFADAGDFPLDFISEDVLLVVFFFAKNKACMLLWYLEQARIMQLMMMFSFFCFEVSNDDGNHSTNAYNDERNFQSRFLFVVFW